MAKRIPALTLSGGRLSEFGGEKEAKEYRVWIHSKKGGDDVYRVFNNLQSAKKFSEAKSSFERREKPLAVVWDGRKKKYREVVVDRLKAKSGKAMVRRKLRTRNKGMEERIKQKAMGVAPIGSAEWVARETGGW